MLKRAFASPDSFKNRVRGFLHPGGCLIGKALRLSVLLRFSASPLLSLLASPPLRPSALLLLLSLAPLLLCSPSGVHAQVSWGPDYRLTNAIRESWSPEVAVSGDTVYVVWEDQRIVPGGSIYFKHSTDAGLTWSPDLKLSLADSGARAPSIAARHDTVHVVWYDYRRIGYVVVYYCQSTDAGTTWGPEVPLSSFWKVCGNPTIAMGDGGDVYVIWDDGTQSNTHLQTFRMSTDGGNTWGRDTVIGQRGGSGITPELEYSRGVLHLIKDQLVVTGSVVTMEIVYRRTTDRGQIWSMDTVLSQVDSVHSFWPRMAKDSFGNIHLSWTDYKYSPYPWTGDIFYRRSTDNGLTWLPIQEFISQHRAVASDVACDSEQVYLAWEDSRNGPNDNFEIYFQSSTDRGVAWGPEEQLTYAPHNSNGPRLGAALNKVHLIWSDARDDTTGNYHELYYKRGFYQVGVEMGEIRKREPNFSLRVSPNPFVEDVWVDFAVPKSGVVALKIYDFSGRLVRNTVEKSPASGNHRVLWDGRDNFGKGVAAGVYFFRVETGGLGEVQRAVKLK